MHQCMKFDNILFMCDIPWSVRTVGCYIYTHVRIPLYMLPPQSTFRKAHVYIMRARSVMHGECMHVLYR